MRKLIFIVFINALVSCKKTEPAPPQPDCKERLQQIDPLYLAAARLDFETLRFDTSAEGNSVIPIYRRIDSVFEKLKAIRNLTIPEADTIFKLYEKDYSYYHNESLRSVWISYTNSDEASNDSDIQKIITKYNLEMSHFEKEPDGGINFSLTSCPFINGYALSREINNTPHGSAHYSPSYAQYTGSSITVEQSALTTTTITIVFGKGYDTCSFGCKKWRYWQFEVDENNMATFIKSWGDPSPPL